MKKNLRFLLALAIGWLTSTGAFALEQVEGVYQIGSAQDFKDFAAIVNSDGRQHQLNAVVTQDFTLDELVMVGAPSNAYSGTFDGQGHTVTINFTMESTGQDGECGLFRRINGATIKNLKVAGTINTKGQLAGGVVSGIWQTAVVENCVSTVTITDEQSGDGTHGGIVARVSDKGGANSIIIRNCAFLGTINAPGRSGSGGILGWPDNAGGGQVKIENCLMAGTLSLATGQDNDIIVRNSATVTNCYYFDQQSMNNSKGATQTTAAQAASGELCFLLNGSQSATPVWFQTIGTDDMPLPIGTAVVYANGSLNCDGTPKGDVTYSNTASEPQRDDHQFNEWGFCSVCNALQPDFLTQENGYYLIGTKQQYNWFMYYANNGHADASAKLTQDLDLSDYNFVSIGNDANRYHGTFDGQGFRVKNMTIVGTTKELGFFSVCSNATIKNLILDASCNINSGDCTAALIGCSNGSGILSIENVGVECNVTGTGPNAAAFVGCNYSGGNLAIQIKNCYNTGNITAGRESAVFSGWFANSSNARVENCWSTGKVTGLDGQNSLGRGIASSQFVSTYDLNSENNPINATKLEGYDASWLTSGQLTYIMNGKQSTDVAWYQTIGTDAHPMLFGSTDIVYANGNLQCDGITPKEGSELTFSNTKDSQVDPHQFNDWGFCSVCDALQPDFMTPDANNCFALGTDKQLNWFAHYATKIDASAKAILTANIDMKDVIGFPGIGSPEKPYTGTFDGQKHIISNLNIDGQADMPAGFFNEATAGAVIKNFTIDNSCYIVGHHYVGAFVGHVAGNGEVLLEQLGNEAEVEAWNQNAGGILGCNTSGELKLTLTNCYNTGIISSTNESGGISGWLGNNAKLINCYNTGEVKGEGSESFARGNNPETTNCFNIAAWKNLPATPAEDFTNGTVYTALAMAAPDTWYLSAEEGGHPVVYVTEWFTKFVPVLDFTSVYDGNEAVDGDFFLYNVQSGLWLQNNEKNTSDWNTRGATGTYGFAFGIKAITNGWQLDPKFGHNHSMNASNFYLDTNDALTTWTLEPVENAEGQKGYIIKDGDRVLSLNNDDNLDWNTGKGDVWQLVTRDDRLKYLKKNAREENPLDATFLIMDPSFANENDRRNSWTWNRDGGNLDDVRWYWNRRSYAVWNSNSFSLKQTINGVLNGTYTLTFKGFYRDGDKDEVVQRRTAGNERLIAKYFINDDKADVMSILDGASDTWVDGLFYYPAADAEAPYGHYPDNADGFNRIFQDYPNAYLNAGVTSVVTTGSMTIGLEKLEKNDRDWLSFDDFRLVYKGSNISISDLLAALNDKISEAEAVNTENTSTKAAENLAAALADAKAALTSDDEDVISDATSALVVAIAVVNEVNVKALRETIALAAEEGITNEAANSAVTNALTAADVDQPLYDLRAARKVNSMRLPDIYKGSKPAEGKVYLFNVGTGTFLGTGSDWNTHAAVDQVGIEIELINENNEEYTFKFKTNRGGGWMAYNGYVDTGGQDLWHFMPVAGKEGVYNISSTGQDGFLLGYDPNGRTDGKKYWSTIAIDRTGLDNPNNQWKVITPAEREALIAAATVNNPVDVSYLIKNASLNRQDGYDMWQKANDGGNSQRVSTINDNNGDRAADFAWEFFEPNSFSFTQTIEGLAPGKYEVSVQAFFRNGNGGAQAEAYNNDEELKQLAYLVANDETALLPNIASVLSKVPGIGDLQACKDGEFPNMPQSAIEYFETGYYKTTLPVTVGEDGKLTIGVKKDTREEIGDWVVLDNFRLRYLGDYSIKTMSIVGDFTGGWPTAEGDWSMAKDMTQDTNNPAIWTLHVEDFEVKFDEGQTERKYEYKATANHKWGIYELPASGNNDWVFGNDREYKAGVYDLDFTVDTENHSLTLVPTFDEVASSINEMNANSKQGTIYNLNGQKVQKAQKGLYILNGRVVVVK